MSESSIIKETLILASKKGFRLFRNNTAKAWAGKIFRSPMPVSVRLNPGDVIVRNAYPIDAGLCKGSSDLIGWKKVTVTPDMVGKDIAVFCAIEVKYNKTATTEDQSNFINQVELAGGIAKILRKADEI